jgi:xylulokinase
VNFLGIDVGTGGTRAVVVNDGGRVVAAATSDHKDFASPQPGWAEQDPSDWWRAACEAVRSVLSEIGGADKIAGVGFSGATSAPNRNAGKLPSGSVRNGSSS